MLELGILKNFDSGTYRAGVQLAGSLTTYFDDVSVAKNIPSGAMVTGNYVIVAIPGGNPKDACVIATWPQGSSGGGTGSFLDLSDTPSSYSGQAAKSLRVNPGQTALEFYHPLWTPAIYTSVFPWVSLDGCTTSIPSGGSINVGTIAVVANSGTTSLNNTLFRSTYGYNNPWPSGKEVTIEFPLSHRTGTVNHRILFLWIYDTNLPPAEIHDHVGFILSAGHLYSSSANGGAQEIQDTGINIGIGDFLYQCKVVIAPGISAKFYVNNVLKTTHTTRPPRANIPNAVLSFGVKTIAAEAQQAAWERIVITKQL
jgi:hypothetical protein